MTEYMMIPINKIGQRYNELRIIDPRAETAMERSMQFYGQMTPVVVCQTEKHSEMIDGFKRLRAAIKLNFTQLSARIFPGRIRAAKAAMIQLNIKVRTISDLEKAMVIRSLHRDDGLTQVEIAALLGRHKSWVCRRLSLVERLSEEVADHLKLGLITTTIGRELSRLPHGNQPGALQTIIKYHFDSRETSRLVALLLTEPRWNHDAILRFPEPILENRHPDPPSKSKEPSLFSRLIKLEIWMKATSHTQPDHVSIPECNRLLSVMDRIETIFDGMRKQLGSM
ncbi:MAG: ParB N-terminal domain-containing protein [FCB group bacterium]|nr:ParB N-terminal domain-containing protein [FCB group bacterium]